MPSDSETEHPASGAVVAEGNDEDSSDGSFAGMHDFIMCFGQSVCVLCSYLLCSIGLFVFKLIFRFLYY